jgi:hypothetical protein
MGEMGESLDLFKGKKLEFSKNNLLMRTRGFIQPPAK